MLLPFRSYISKVKSLSSQRNFGVKWLIDPSALESPYAYILLTAIFLERVVVRINYPIDCSSMHPTELKMKYEDMRIAREKILASCVEL